MIEDNNSLEAMLTQVNNRGHGGITSPKAGKSNYSWKNLLNHTWNKVQKLGRHKNQFNNIDT